MTRFRTTLLGTALAAGLSLGLGAEAEAAPMVSFNFTAFDVTLGVGFEQIPGTTAPNRIDLHYEVQNPPAVPWAFTLPAIAGQATSRTIGTFLLREECTATSNATCLASAEFNNLEVTAADLTVTVKVTFTLPVMGTATLNPTVVAVPGLITDAGDDLIISFSGQQVAFGNGGIFTIDIADMAFDNCAVSGNAATGPNIRRCVASLPIAATIELTSPETPVPAPAALAVMGMGLLGLAAVGRRRRIA